ncbi:putative opsin [Panus rudis PR-1116 ss-1]|nr:putative opsin [Panus rudis PR-1116 ss-1]
MANASAKRIASQNGTTTRNLRLGLMISGFLSLLLRLFLQRGSLSPARLSFWIYVLSMIPSIFLTQYMIRIGSPRYDPTSGALISAGEDLSRPGIMEWCFDVVYITWACQVGSGLFGQWVWWLYMVIPGYAVFKLWGSFISPILLGRSSSPESAEEADTKQAVSKRQEKLRKRSERGDPRVRVQSAR